MVTKRGHPPSAIVFLSVGNPIAMGLVNSLPAPRPRTRRDSADILADLSIKLVDLGARNESAARDVDYLGIADGPTAFTAMKEPNRLPKPRAVASIQSNR